MRETLTKEQTTEILNICHEYKYPFPGSGNKSFSKEEFPGELTVLDVFLGLPFEDPRKKQYGTLTINICCPGSGMEPRWGISFLYGSDTWNGVFDLEPTIAVIKFFRKTVKAWYDRRQERENEKTDEEG